MDPAATPRFFGVYRAVVRDTDPATKRLKVAVPEISDFASLGWAFPCLPPGGTAKLPAVNTVVWVMFEQGDAMRPVWLGTWVGV